LQKKSNLKRLLLIFKLTDFNASWAGALADGG
jgi:hypothetical protein